MMPADLARQIELLNAHLADLTEKFVLVSALADTARRALNRARWAIRVLLVVVLIGGVLIGLQLRERADTAHRICTGVNRLAYGETQLWSHALASVPVTPLPPNPTPAERTAFDQRQQFEADLKTFFSPVKC